MRSGRANQDCYRARRYQVQSYRCILTTDPMQHLPIKIGAHILRQLSLKQQTSVRWPLCFVGRCPHGDVKWRCIRIRTGAVRTSDVHRIGILYCSLAPLKISAAGEEKEPDDDALAYPQESPSGGAERRRRRVVVSLSSQAALELVNRRWREVSLMASRSDDRPVWVYIIFRKNHCSGHEKMTVNMSFDGPIFWKRQVAYIYCCSCHFQEHE
ncbi:unnamed protein product, partial [Litomosoides sigmodontis]